jgi:hypothetical protein
VGSWGNTAHESDTGLDLLAVAMDRYLRGVKFKTFHIRHITELLRCHIIDEFVRDNNGCESQYIDFFYEYTFQYGFAHAVMLVAECFMEYRQKGKYILEDYTGGKLKKRRITEFIYTRKDLEALLTELKAILDPQNAFYETWKESDYFNEWQAHTQMLCDTLSQAISEGGEGHE